MTPPNDWGIKKTIYTTVIITILVLALAVLNWQGIEIPVLQQVIGFIFLTFAPGILILKILKIHNIPFIKSILYSVGLSLAFVMFTGFTINLVLPHTGIDDPISIMPTTIIFMMSIGAISFIAYKRDREYKSPSRKTSYSGRSPASPSLFLILIATLTVLGALFANYYQNNFLLLVIIPLITIILLLAICNKFVSTSVYPLALIMIALALILQQTLSSNYLTGYDIHVEYYYQNLVTTNDYWDSTLPHTYNSMLSITMLGPIYSIILHMDNVWVLKIIYPLIFSLVPSTLFLGYKEQIGEKKAFIAAFFFMALFTFSTEIIALARQQVAELFFALLILIIIEKDLRPIQKLTMAIIFIFGVVVSHYGLTYIGIGLFAISWLLIYLMKTKGIITMWQRLLLKLGGTEDDTNAQTNFISTLQHSLLNGRFVILFTIIALAWYMYMASSQSFEAITTVASDIIDEIGKIFSPEAREIAVGSAVGYGFFSAPILGKLFRITQFLTQFLIILGLLKLVLRPKNLRFRGDYTALCLASTLLLLICIILPFFSSQLNISRIYHIALIFLAPLLIVGCEIAANFILERIRYLASPVHKFVHIIDNTSINNKRHIPLKSYALYALILVILIPYFLFGTGFIFEVTKQEYVPYNIPSTLALSGHRIDGPMYNKQEANGAEWIKLESNENNPEINYIFCDEYGRLLLYENNYPQVRLFDYEQTWIPDWSYVYIRSWNINNNELLIFYKLDAQVIMEHINLNNEKVDFVSNVINKKNEVYNNSGSIIYR